MQTLIRNNKIKSLPVDDLVTGIAPFASKITIIGHTDIRRIPLAYRFSVIGNSHRFRRDFFYLIVFGCFHFAKILSFIANLVLYFAGGSLFHQPFAGFHLLPCEYN